MSVTVAHLPLPAGNFYLWFAAHDPMERMHRIGALTEWQPMGGLLVTGGPTRDKPTVTFAPPADPQTVSHELTIRVPDCRAAYETLTARGAVFLTPPVDWGGEIRCFFRDPDGHLLEISQVTQRGPA